jgi:hypothetical protein
MIASTSPPPDTVRPDTPAAEHAAMAKVRSALGNQPAPATVWQPFANRISELLAKLSSAGSD